MWKRLYYILTIFLFVNYILIDLLYFEMTYLIKNKAFYQPLRIKGYFRVYG